MIMDIPDKEWGPQWSSRWSPYAMRKLCLKLSKNLLSLMVSRSLKNIDHIAEADEVHGHS